jgi:hypothetical protein
MSDIAETCHGIGLPQVFVSYSRACKMTAVTIANRLGLTGFDVILPDWSESRIANFNKFSNCDYAVFIIPSKGGVGVLMEAALALDFKVNARPLLMFDQDGRTIYRENWYTTVVKGLADSKCIAPYGISDVEFALLMMDAHDRSDLVIE